MDIEFLAAGALLERGAVSGLPAVPALLRAHVQGERVEQLLEGYALLRRVESRSRWLAGRASETLPTQGESAEQIAELVAPGMTADALVRMLQRTCTQIRAAYRAVIHAGSIRALA